MNQQAVIVIVLCIAVVTSYSSAKSAHQTKSKRQSFLSVDPIVLECVAQTGEVQCTSGFNQGLADTFAQCRQNDLAMAAAEQCARNENGELCASKLPQSLNTLYQVLQVCTVSTSLYFGTSCSQECTNVLQTMRNNLGCCINHFFKRRINANLKIGKLPFSEVFGHYEITQYFTPSFWSSCGVQTVTDCPSIPAFTSSSEGESCTFEESIERAHTYQCEQSQPALDILSMNNNCQNFAATLVKDCEQLDNGTFCSTISTASSSLMSSASSQCNTYEATQNCTNNCRDAIEEFRDNIGCCVNNQFTFTRMGSGNSIVTSYELWNACDVSTPGLCNSTLINEQNEIIGPTSAVGAPEYSIVMCIGMMLAALFVHTVTGK